MPKNMLVNKIWLMAAELGNVDLICSQIQQWLMEQNLVSHQFAVELLTREALNNAILYGARMNATRQVRYEIQRDDRTLRMIITDDGLGFNWQSYLNREVVDPTKESGRGVRLYRLYTDSVVFNELGNQVILTRLLKN